MSRNTTPNGGSAFWLELPNAAVVSPSRPDTIQAAASPSSGRLLLVDDVAMNRDVLGAFLRDAGYTVVLADGGQEAIRLASEQMFDLILMDVRMPEIDGLEATRRIRALPGRHGQISMLALTAYAFPDQVVQCRLAGMDGHVAKPAEYRTLIHAVADAIALVPPRWRDGYSASPPAEDETQPPLRFDRAQLDKAIASLPPTEVSINLQLLRARKEQMVRLLDQPTDPSLLADAARALCSAAGMFGFVALSKVARRFERAVARDGKKVSRLAQTLRAENCAALAALDEVLRDRSMEPVVTSGSIGGGVIVVEDDPLARGIIRAVLQFAKQQVFLAADGLEAVILARQFKARLVLLDVAVPGLNGLLACEAIRVQPGYADVPIVMLTGYNDERMHNAAQRLGATDFVTKPFRPDVLLARLEVYLDAPVRALRGVFLDVPAQASPEAALADDDDSLREGWINMESARLDGPHAPLKGLRHSVQGAFLYAGVPLNLVQKWLGYAQLSSVTVGCDAVGAEANGIPVSRLEFLP